MQGEDFFIVSSYVDNIYSFFKQNNIDYSLNRIGAYMLLSYGFMLDSYTLCSEIKRIFPGNYLTIEGHQFKEIEYYRLAPKEQEGLSLDEAIEQVDQAFRDAVKLQFDKDKEYGYQHLVSLSAGLDSRMTSLVAHEMGYTNQLNITFSQTTYWDQVIPMKIAEDFGHEWLFKALDNGYWLKDIDANVKANGGNLTYYALAFTNWLYKNMNFGALGMLHSGQLGDAVLGRSFVDEASPLDPYVKGMGAFSERLLDRLGDINLKMYGRGREVGMMYYRGFNGANGGGILRKYTESCAPFENIEFMQVAMSMPLFSKNRNMLYEEWIKRKYPKAADYGWEARGGHKLTERTVTIKGITVYASDLPKIILRKLHLLPKLNDETSSRKHMNPLAYYMENNKEVRAYLKTYIATNLPLVEDDSLRNDIQLMLRGNGVEKIQALTLLSAIKLYF